MKMALSKEDKKKQMKILNKASKALYEALKPLTNGQAVCMLEQAKIDIILNDKLVTLNGTSGPISKKSKPGLL